MKFSVCASDTRPHFDKKINLLTSDKCEQFNNVFITPLPNKQVTDDDSLFSI